MSQTGKSKRNQRESNLAEKYQTEGPFTTVMIRNIPTEYTQDELILEVSEVMGSPHSFDFFYLPWDTQNDCNIGYVFVNFPDPGAAQNAVRAFSNYHFRLHDSKKVGKVSPAHIQGLENNLRHLQDRAVVLGNHPCSPIVMWKGQKVELSLIFQELRTQDTLRKFENGTSSCPGERPQPSQNDLAQAAAEALKAPGPHHQQVLNVGETFADLLDRAAGLSHQQGAVMNPGLVMPYMNQRAASMTGSQHMRQGMLSPPGSCSSAYMVPGTGGASPAAAAAFNRMMSGGPGLANGQQCLSPMAGMLPPGAIRAPQSEKGLPVGPPPGQFFARKPEMSAPNLSLNTGTWPSPQELAAMGFAADPNLYNSIMQNQAPMCNNSAPPFMNAEDDIFGGDEQESSNFDQRIPASVSHWSGPAAPPGLAPPPAMQQDGGSNKGRSSMLSPPTSATGRQALRPGLQSSQTAPSAIGNAAALDALAAEACRPDSPAAIPNLPQSAGVKEINMKSADQNLLDKFMAKFGSPS
eukprot:CAMPEP_0181429858 /NCGR_PEP_ID=MMETSP1110-20121109/17421_1 /TAXON_ID=174948 /ORGANISM="Symbiodinium sp., Strain CCMP421" /LENGTH=520 /DNA_ID=CAMNT_0023553149 /DNA_START=63 /DNA_END=1625 /DNA_ORIENTATION=+